MAAASVIVTIGAAVGVGLVAACQFDTSGLDTDGGAAIDAAPGDDGDQDPRDGGDQARTPLRIGDVRLAFGQVSSSRLHTSRWSRTALAWMPAENTPATAGSPAWTVNVVTPGPEAEELLAAQVATVTGQTFVALSWNDDGWRQDWSESVTLSPTSKRAFDLALEASGDALMVYATDSATPAYRTRTGGVWSAPLALPLNDGPGPSPDTNLGVVEWIELEGREGGDEIALLFSDSNRDLVAMMWNGDSWVTSSARTLELDLKQNSQSLDVANRGFDVAISSASGLVMAAWARNSADGFHYNTWTAAAGWLANPVRVTGVVSGYPHFIDLASNPVGDFIAGGFFDLGDGTERAGAATWDGTAWIDRTTLDNQSRNVDDKAPGDMPGAVAWLGRTGVAVCLYADDQEGTLDWARWEGSRGWSLEPDVAFAGKGFTESIAIASAPDGDRLVIALSDSNLRLYATTYNGTTWQLSNDGLPLTNVISNGSSVPFSLATRRQ
ncbi:MAG TPA: hypothetical protein VML75_04930 [Kofleriaceae bacterium]|nr:hypothetical protein [Kofleriaceae bacterium]